jgi:hypothetical protein
VTDHLLIGKKSPAALFSDVSFVAGLAGTRENATFAHLLLIA